VKAKTAPYFCHAQASIRKCEANLATP